MKFIYKIESVLIIIISLLCSILLLKSVFKLRSALLWRVNCWFCNKNFWVKFLERNCWNCPSCEQYNGFTKDGDYNKTLINTNEQNVNKIPNIFQRSPPRNGLCKECNINQQLKIMQLANFIPMNERNFNEEIESYKTQLEKAYKLCTLCKKTVLMKLNKEKEILLGSKVLQSRTPEKNKQKNERQNKVLKNSINNTSMVIAGVILILVSVECYKNVMRHENLFSTISNVKQFLTGLVESVYSIVKMKMFMTFPILEIYFNDINNLLDLDTLPKSFNFRYKGLDKINELTQKALGGFVCLIQIIGHLWNINKLSYSILIDLLWSVFVIAACFAHPMGVAPLFVSFIKLLSMLTIILVYKRIKSKNVQNVSAKRMNMTPKRMKTLANGSTSSLTDDEDAIHSDDDVSLSKFGLHNITDSSHETFSPSNISLNNGRSFTPRISNSVWAKPKLNSTFCVNSSYAKSPSSISDNIFVKPSFNKYQKLAKDDSDSELDESISTLCIGSPKKVKERRKNNSVFALRKFRATPMFVAPTPVSLTRSRPLISPSKLGHSTSWIAEGYWGSEGDQLFNLNGSRSSSQSSGFESQASSANQRTFFSQPPSREESVWREPDKSAPLLDRFQNCNMNGIGGFHSQPNYVRMSLPVFPQMQYNSHVHIPQARFAQPAPIPNTFAQQQFVQNGLFKSPCATGLIKLPQVDSLSPRR